MISIGRIVKYHCCDALKKELCADGTGALAALVAGVTEDGKMNLWVFPNQPSASLLFVSNVEQGISAGCAELTYSRYHPDPLDIAQKARSSADEGSHELNFAW